jgi:hypothetical protein
MMNLNQRLLVCEAMLARLDAALAHADAEIACTAAVEKHMGALVTRLKREHESPNPMVGLPSGRERPTAPVPYTRAANENRRGTTSAKAILSKAGYPLTNPANFPRSERAVRSL